MMNVQNDYRINVRFRLDRPDEKEAAEYLNALGRSRNHFIVEAVINQIGIRIRLCRSLSVISERSSEKNFRQQRLYLR